MNRVNNNKKSSRKKSKKEIDEIDFDEVSIKSSKKVSKNLDKKGKTKKEIKQEKKRAKKEARKKGIRNFFLKLFFILILIVIAFGIFFYNKTVENGGGIKGALVTVLGLSVENVDSLEPINVLLLGMSEDIEAKLTDTIILCSYNPKNQAASMISIPRDTFIGKNKDQAKGGDKINTLYHKNPDKLLKTVSEMTGIDVEYYAVVKTQALIEIVDIVGGVDFDVPIDMNYDDPTQNLHIHLKKGMQEIDGEEAEQLLRFRHNNDGSSYPANYGDNDYGRMKTQRAFITETVKQTINFKNIFKSKQIIDTIFANIETNLVLDDILPYLPNAVDFKLDEIVSNQLPGVSERCNNLWFFVQDKKETKELIKELGISNKK